MHVSKQFVLCSLLSLSVASPVNNLSQDSKRNAAVTPYGSKNSTLMTYGTIDPIATAGAKSLLKYIQSQYGVQYLSGQQDPASMDWVTKNIGKTPAILGNDFIDYSPSRIANGASPKSVEDAIAFDTKGGINAFVWHWNAPINLYNTAAEPWYFGFYTKATSFDFQAALNQGPTGANYKLLLRDIDAIAVQIKRLSDAGVPILFRPLHEPEGGWFWWGTKGAASSTSSGI